VGDRRKAVVMSPKQYRAALVSLGLTQAAAGRLLGVGERTSRRYAERGIGLGGGSTEILLRLLLMKTITPRDIGNAIRHRSI
jgi:hypothetical protein